MRIKTNIKSQFKHWVFGNGKRVSFRRVCSVICAVVIVIFSTVISLGEQFNWPLPTWHDLFVMTGLRDDLSLGEDQFRITVFDRGNADCILLQTGDRFALIDAAEDDDADKFALYLQRQGIDRLDYVIATHPDADHIGGMDEIVNSTDIGTFMMPYMPEDYEVTTAAYEKLLTALVEKEITPLAPEHGQTFIFGNAVIKILSGISQYEDTNDQSIVCMITFGDTRFLMMGDAGSKVEKELLASGIDLKADVLKAGHHGSRYSSSKDFLEAVSPSYTLITSGLGNSYNHPHKETLNNLRDVNSKIYRNDLNGKITVLSDGKTVTVTTEKRSG